jgi:hypothetical protein
VVIEGVVPEAEVLDGTASGPKVPIAPEITEEVRDDTLPESSMYVIVRSPEIQDCGANPFSTDVGGDND